MMKKLFNKWGGSEEGKGKKAAARASEGLVRGPDVPILVKSGPQLHTAGSGENGVSDKDPPEAFPARPVPSFITNSINLPSYGQSTAVPLPLPSEAIALPLPEPSQSHNPFPNSQGNPQSLPTEESVSPGGFGFPNQGLTRLAPEGDPTTASDAEKGVSNKTGLTISRTGGNKLTYGTSRGLTSVFRSGPKAGKAGRGEAGVRSNQNPLPFNFPNQRPTPLETVRSGPKRGQVPRPVTDATASEPAVSPQLGSDLSTPSPNMTPRSVPDWTSAMPPVSPFWNRTSPGNSPSPLPPKLRRSPSLNSNPETSSVDHSNTSSPLSRFNPAAHGNPSANQGPGKQGKSAPSSPAHSESVAVGKTDAFGSGHSIGSAMSEPPLSTDSAELISNQTEAPESIRTSHGAADETKQPERGEVAHGRHLLSLDPWEESGRDDTSEASSLGGSESTESSGAGTWLNSSSPRKDKGTTLAPRVHFDLNAPQAVPGSTGMGVQGILLSPRGKAGASEGLGNAPPLVGVPEGHEAPRFAEGGYKKEVGEEDLTRSVTPRTAEALQGEAGRQKGSQATSPAPLGVRSPQKAVGGVGNRVQRPLNTHLNVPKQLTPINAGPAWHESIAGLPVSSSEAASSALQAHPLPDIGQAYTPPPSVANTPSPRDGTSMPPAPQSHASRGVTRVAQNRTLSSPEPHPHHSRASSDGRLKSNEASGPGKPMQLDGGPRPRPHRNQSEPIPRVISEAPFYPRPEVHPLPLSDAARTLSDPILPRVQKRTSLDQDATPLPLPLPPAEDKATAGKGVGANQGPSSPVHPSPLPLLPSAGYPLTPSVLPLGKPASSPSPSVASTRSLSPHASPISVLQRGDRNSREFRGGLGGDQVAPGPKLPVHWRKGEKLGSGTFGSVYRGLNSDTGEMFAVKEVGDAQQNVWDESTLQLEHEVALLSRLKHPNIVQYVGTKREDGKLYIFLEFMPGGSIESNLRAYGRFTEPLIRAYTKQILCGLKYLHDQSTIHRDIKGANILVDINGRVKLADFGMAKQICETNSLAAKSGIKGSPFWMAPEVVKHERRSDGRPADIWSVGCTVLEMAEGVPPWSRDCTNPIQIIWKIASSTDYPHIPEHLSQTAVDFIKACLNRSPDQRPKVDDLLNHPFIADVIPETPTDLSAALPRVSPPGTPSPRPAPPVVPRTANRTSHSPAAPRLSRQTSGKELEERIAEEEEGVSATVAALVDSPSPRASGAAVKQVAGTVKLRPKTPPPNWSPNGTIPDEPKPGTGRSRQRDGSGSGRGGEQNGAWAKPSLRWKSPPSGESAAPRVESSFRFAEVGVEEHPRPPLTRHKSVDAPTLRFPLSTLLEDDQVESEKLQKVLSVPVEATRTKSGPLDKFGASNLPLNLDHKRYIQGEVV